MKPVIRASKLAWSQTSSENPYYTTFRIFEMNAFWEGGGQMLSNS